MEKYIAAFEPAALVGCWPECYLLVYEYFLDWVLQNIEHA